MTTFVLLSGSWHGGWCWQHVRPLLLAAGHDVRTPTYTGVGERLHLGSPEVSMATHVEDVVSLLEFDDLRQVTLVGHSYGGLVMTAVADRVPDRVAQLIYLDTSIPKSGDSVLSLMHESSRAVVQSRLDPDGWRVWPTSVDRLGIEDPADREWVTARLTTHPYRGFSEPITLSGAADAIPRAYIECRRTPDQPTRPGAQAAKDNGWPYLAILSGHDAMITQPRLLAEALLALI